MRGRRFAYLAVGIFAAAGVLLLAGPAGASRQVHSTAATNVHCGDTINTSITMNGDLDCSGYGATALTVTSSGVTFNLGGHTITGNNSYDVIVADGTCTNGPCDGVTVTNGTITNGSAQVDFWGNSDTASSLKLNNAGSEGVFLDYTTNADVTGNTITGAGSEGVYGEYDANDVVYGNVLTNDSYGVYFDYASANTVSSNYTRGNANYGMYDDESNLDVFAGNISTADSSTGFYIDEDECGSVTMTNNTARVGGGDGFDSYYNYGSTYCDGYSAQPPYSMFSGNQANYNAGDGIYDEESFQSTWNGNSASRNGSYGFEFYRPGFETVTNNTSKYNASSGFYIEGNLTYDSYNLDTFSNNTALYNMDWGFYGDYGVPGSGNSGSNTNSPADCYDVAGCS